MYKKFLGIMIIGSAFLGSQAKAEKVSVSVDMGTVILAVSDEGQTEMLVVDAVECGNQVKLTHSGGKITLKHVGNYCPKGATVMLKIAKGDSVDLKMSNGLIKANSVKSLLAATSKLDASIRNGMISSQQTGVWVQKVGFTGAKATYSKSNTSKINIKIVLSSGYIQL